MTTPTKEQIEIKDPCVDCEFADMIIPGSLTPSCFTPCKERIRFLYRQYNKKDKKQP